MEYFTNEQMRTARQADLYKFLRENHSESFVFQGQSIRLRSNKSISIKNGYSGYYDFSTGEHGNSVDFLVRYMDYRLDEAVFSLCGYGSNTERTNVAGENLPPVFPPPLKGKYKHLFAYLLKRGISAETIQLLVDRGLLYQEGQHNNIVFVNEERDWAELRGTYDRGLTAFHGVVENCRRDGYWMFMPGDDAEVAYICEAAIDAISLYELHRKMGWKGEAAYISIGGVGKQPAIDTIKNSMEAVLAVDNDEAGEECRKRNPDLMSVIPIHKDWNEDLLSPTSPTYSGICDGWETI